MAHLNTLFIWCLAWPPWATARGLVAVNMSKSPEYLITFLALEPATISGCLVLYLTKPGCCPQHWDHVQGDAKLHEVEAQVCLDLLIW